MPTPRSQLLVTGLVVSYVVLRSLRREQPASTEEATLVPVKRNWKPREVLTSMPLCDGDGDEDLSRVQQLLHDLINPEPTPGHLYPVVKGDTIGNVTRRALGTFGVKVSERMRCEYAWNIASGAYNITTYGTPSTTRTYDAKYLVPGIGLGVRVAFLPRNEDAIVCMRSGRFPVMSVDPRTGAPRDASATSRGLLWLPPVDPAQLEEGVVTCRGYVWEDGSSTIDIDPELRGYLETV